jgi:regulator of RNase E activity RraB
MTDYVIREFLKDGRLKVVRKEDADAILEGEIVNYVNEVLQYDVSYVPIQYRLKIDVNIKFIDAKTNQVLFVQEKVGALSGGTATYFVRPDVGFDVKTEFEAQKEIYEKLAKYIVNRVIYGWEKPFER